MTKITVAYVRNSVHTQFQIFEQCGRRIKVWEPGHSIAVHIKTKHFSQMLIITISRFAHELFIGYICTVFWKKFYWRR